MKRISQIVSAALLGGMLSTASTFVQADTVTAKAVMEQYVNLASANFSDTFATATNVLQERVDAFIANPTADTQQAAKDAWFAARKPYSQTEAFRFGNPNVDEWEGQVNAWPLDEGLIDYVKTDVYEGEEGNQFATANIIAGTDKIDAELLKASQEKGGSEANVATGYHAIEFLLSGQDFNATPKDSGTRGSLSLGELAGERMNVALLAHSQEDEHSCFSDNTHNDIAENARSIQNIFNGTYTRTDSTKVTGASLAQLVASKDAKTSETLVNKLADTQQKAEAIVEAAKNGENFDQQIAVNNKDGNKRIKATIAALRSQTGDIETAAKAVGVENLNPESSDSFGG